MYKEINYWYFRLILAILITFGAISVSPQNQREIFTGNPISTHKSLVFANPSADLDQCANGGVGDPALLCVGTAWQNGNLGHSQAHYLEGESVPYRMRFGSLMPGTIYTLTIEWDTTINNSGNHALDYLTTFDASETGANPCSGVPGCNLAVNDTAPIPIDVNVTSGNDGIAGNADDIVQIPGAFTLFGGQFTGVSAYMVTGDYNTDSQTKITIFFRANTPDPVIAWGGHISTRLDWGINHSSIAITGSPYHMRLLDLNGAGGNQDRSLSSSATIFPGRITIIKDARPNTNQIFGFTANGPAVSDFSLVDDGTNPGNIHTFDNLTDFGSANSVTVTENMPTGFYSLTQILCVEDASGGSGEQNSTVNIPSRFANIILEEGESVTCTFINAVPTAALATISGKITDTGGNAVKDVSVTLANPATSAVRYTRTNSFGNYRFEELPAGETYIISVNSKRYTFIFDTRIITLIDDLRDADFMVLPN